MPHIRSDLVGVIYLPGGARLSAGDPVPPGEVVGAHLIEGAEPAEATAEAVEPQPEPVAPRPATSRTRKRSSGRAR
ncbi:hypothetical protein [Mycobacteroides chelonae]|jgi:hypothetical protein|uniref:hypothetical protein n=1 Tax=Mycobacteroides chelonae TaxID=1774 RepID=UPI0008A91F43|nr:hypothetical protein [Mycobacteroides chelonae]MBF9326013.1 hypothetical protein [Mycobacteroides chelonae]MBF9420189.1 hypothetical protein [Mycobacteroides chelonae]MBF9438657.1 hypothetical protein [Mycobacteroides chelonae]MBV6359966.1 hypothetical protein [Mycobacteroides chelonae]MEC4834431.1 hypothetical protein [Mycobacteroides chelonae]